MQVNYGMEERFFIDEIASEDETLHLDALNVQSNQLDYNLWVKFAKDLIEKGNYYKSTYAKSKSDYAKEKSESIYKKSIVCSDESINLNPNNIDSWYNKGLALSNLGEYHKAIKCYDKVIEIDPDYRPAWNSKGNVFKYLSKFQEAIGSYDRVLEKDSRNIIALYNKGLALSNLGKYDEAIECYDRLIETDPNNIEAFNAKGYALERLGRYDDAELCYNRVTEEYLNEINLMKESAINYQKLNKYEEAIICYDRIITIDANNNYALLNKGFMLYNLNKYEKAIECYDRIIGLDKYKEKFNKSGQKSTDKQVIEYYGNSIKTDPNNIEALNAKGYALERLGRYDEAIQIFDIVILQKPIYVIDTIIKKGHILIKREKYSEAEECFNEGLHLDPNNTFILTELQLLYSNYTFQYTKAISVTEKLLKNVSDLEAKRDTKLLLAQNLICTRKYVQGREVAKQVIKNLPDQAIRRRGIARALVLISYLLQGKKYEGIEELEKFLAYYNDIDIDVKSEEDQWNFKGINYAISRNEKIDRFTKTIFHNLIDLLQGNKDSQKPLSSIAEETIEEANKKRIRKKIIYTSIGSIVIVAIIGILFAYVMMPVSCSITESQPLKVGNNPRGIDFNPTTNKAYITNENDKTISVLDCNVPRYNQIFNKYLNTNNKIEVEGAPIPLKYSPVDIAANPTTNRIYILHQSPPSVSVMDEKNHLIMKSIPVGNTPLDIAVNT
ncbi:MAG: tetratricopeptide repeat protein, partial [Nitrososphaeraceae archaeon]